MPALRGELSHAAGLRLVLAHVERELELQLVPDGNVVRAKWGDLGFEAATFDDRVAMHSDPVPTATLVEAERVEIVVRGDEPDAPATGFVSICTRRLEQRCAGALRDGLVRAVGLSNYSLEDVERCHAERPVDAVQVGLNVIDYIDDRADIARCGELGIAVTIFEPLASGIWSDKTREQVLAYWTGPWVESAFYKRLLSPGRAERSFAVADGLRSIAERLGATVAQVANAWVLHQPGVTAAIAGSRDGGHMQENAGAAALDLSSVLTEIEELIPLGPIFAPPV